MALWSQGLSSIGGLPGSRWEGVSYIQVMALWSPHASSIPGTSITRAVQPKPLPPAAFPRNSWTTSASICPSHPPWSVWQTSGWTLLSRAPPPPVVPPSVPHHAPSWREATRTTWTPGTGSSSYRTSPVNPPTVSCVNL